MGDLLGGIININDHEFALISRLVFEKFGINLTDKKKSLVQGRLNKLIKELGLRSFREYYDYVTKDVTGKSLTVLIDKISTNHSYFFRESSHFDFMIRTALPEIIHRKETKMSKKLRIWCAGCAAGEEPYSISILLSEFFGSQIDEWDLGILATDISLTVLNQALTGIYTKEKLRDVPVGLVKKYFIEGTGDEMKVEQSVRKRILFKRMNLMDSQFPIKNPFDIIFCRNVMIYFDQNTRNQLVSKFYEYTLKEGYLFIGHSESIPRDATRYRFIKPAIYKKI